MKVLLLKNIPKVGKKDEIVDVPDGYARNALFPNRSAIQATADVLARHQSELKRREDTSAFEHSMLEKLYASIQGKSFTISAPHNDKGVLFKKILVFEMIAHIEKQENVTLDRGDLAVDQDVIKRIGAYTLHSKTFPQYSFAVEIK